MKPRIVGVLRFNDVETEMKIKAIVTGATGMVGEGVLFECLNNPNIEQVLVINRKPAGVVHTKLREIIHSDFYDLKPIESQLVGYNACFFCLGTSSIGMTEEQYRHVTYDLTLGLGKLLAKLNPDLTFCYVTGKGTDSTEQGRVAWARIKGKTENDLMKLFKKSYMYRIGFTKASPGQKNLKNAYKLFAWVYPIGRTLYPSGFCTLQEVGKSMIQLAQKGYAKQIIDVKDIVTLASAN